MNILKSSLIIFSFCFYSAHASAEVVAKVGNKNITLKEFKTKYNKIKKQTINPPRPEVFLQDLIKFEMGVQEAHKRKLDKDPIVQYNIKQELYKGLLEKELGMKVQKIKVTQC